MAKINILYVIESMKIGGAEMLVAELCRKIDKRRFNVIVCSLCAGDAISKKLDQNGIRYYVFDKEPGIDLSIALKLRKIFKKEKIDIVHTHCQGPLIYTFLATIAFRSPLFVHTEHINLEQEFGYSKRYVLYNKIVLRRLKGFVSISEQVTEYFIKKFPWLRNIIKTIPNGIDISRFCTNNSNNSLRNELNLSENIRLIGNISALREQKDQATLIRAMKYVIDYDKNIRLIIAGSGYLEEFLEDLVRQLNLEKYIFFLGYRSDVEILLSNFEVFILPSLYEGLPLCLLEASASGVPIVATDIPGNNEVVRNCSNGILVPPRHPEKLASAIIEIISDENLGHNYSENGKKYAKLIYDQNVMTLKYETYYSTLMNRNCTKK